MDKFLTSKPALDTKSDTKEGLLLQDISNQLPETRRSNRKSLSVKEPNNNVIKKEKKREIKQEAEANDEPVKKKAKTTKQKEKKN